MKPLRPLALAALAAPLCLSALPAQAASSVVAKASRVEKVVRKLEKKDYAKKRRDQVNIPYNWSLGVGSHYAWSNADVDPAVHWEIEAQKRVSTYGVVALGFQAGQHNLNAGGGDMDVWDINLSYLQYVSEDNRNRQPSFYYGAGLDLLGTQVTGAGDSTDLGLHLRLGVEFKGGAYTELRYSLGPDKQKFNNARLGSLTLGGGYRFSL